MSLRQLRNQDPGRGFKSMTLAEVAATPPQNVRRIYVPTGDVTVINSYDETVTIPEADMDAVQNQATFYKEITSITGTHIYVSF